jgi:hypothetical protein
MSGACDRRLVLALSSLAALCLLAGAALASAERGAIPPRFVPERVSQRAARRETVRQLSALPSPSDARPVAGGSRLTAKLLRGRYPFLSSGANHNLFETKFLFVDRGPQAAIRWFAAHPPAGAKLAYRTAGPHRSKRYRCLWFEWPDGRPLTGERTLILCAVRSHGGTSVRIDSQAVWLEGRSPYERIPGGTHYMTVTATTPQGPDRRAVVSNAGLIERVVALLNSLPVTQHTSYSCPHGIASQPPPHPAVEIVFRSSRDGPPIAGLFQTLPVSSGCRPMGFSLRGRRERSLDEGWIVIRALDRVIEGARVTSGEGARARLSSPG